MLGVAKVGLLGSHLRLQWSSHVEFSSPGCSSILRQAPTP